MGRVTLLVICFSLVLISCTSSGNSWSRSRTVDAKMDGFEKYRSMIEKLPVLEKKGVDAEHATAQILYKSPIVANMQIEAQGGRYVISVNLANNSSAPWFYPRHDYYLDGSFMIADNLGAVVDRGPISDSLGRIKLTDEMFLEIPAQSSSNLSYIVPLDKLAALGQEQFCARFANSQIPPSVGEYFAEVKNTVVSVVLESNELCFDLIKSGGDVRISNIGPAGG